MFYLLLLYCLNTKAQYLDKGAFYEDKEEQLQELQEDKAFWKEENKEERAELKAWNKSEKQDEQEAEGKVKKGQ